MKLSFSLPNKAVKPVGAAPPLKKPAIFSSLGDDDDHVDAAPTLSDNKGAAANKKLLAQNVESSKAARKRMEEEMKVDSTVYQYDEVWDRMQEVKVKQKEAKEVDAKQRKVRVYSVVPPGTSLPTMSYSPNTSKAYSLQLLHDG